MQKDGTDSSTNAHANQLRYQLTGGRVDLFFFAGPSPTDVVEQYHSLIGFPVMPPLWALGFHQCRWGYEDLQAVIDVADGYQVRACLLMWVGIW